MLFRSYNMNNIKKYRLAAGMKQVELCRIVGITQGALSGWENGKYEPDLKSLNKMAELFGVTIDQLMGYAPSDEKKEAPSKPDEDDIKVALFGGDGEITDEMWNEVKQYAEYIKAKYKK